MYSHPTAGGVRLEKARRGVRIGTVIPPENGSDQRATTVLNAIFNQVMTQRTTITIPQFSDRRSLPENGSDQRTTTVLNAICVGSVVRNLYVLRKVTLHTCAKVLGLFPKYWA